MRAILTHAYYYYYCSFTLHFFQQLRNFLRILSTCCSSVVKQQEILIFFSFKLNAIRQKHHRTKQSFVCICFMIFAYFVRKEIRHFNNYTQKRNCLRPLFALKLTKMRISNECLKIIFSYAYVCKHVLLFVWTVHEIVVIRQLNNWLHYMFNTCHSQHFVRKVGINNLRGTCFYFNIPYPASSIELRSVKFALRYYVTAAELNPSFVN